MANPFMVTSNECYGMSLSEASKRVSYSSPIQNEVGKVATSADNASNKGRAALPGVATGNGSNNSGPNPFSTPSSQQDMSFLYSRESDRFGEGSTFSDSSLSRVFRMKESDSMNKRRKNSVFVKKLTDSTDIPTRTPKDKTVPKEEVDQILARYNHNPKPQNALYGTSANEYGLKKPSAATIPSVRHGMSQQFSQSFNRTMFRDEGLNASMTKSNIHDLLTPQFV